MRRICAVLAIAFLATSAAWADGTEGIRRARHPAISPDGKQVAFSYQGDIWSVSSEGGRAVRLTVHKAYDAYPVYSPDGKTLAFASNRYGNYDIFLMDADGGVPRRLTFSSADDIPEGFTPDRKWLLLRSGTYGGLEICKVRVTSGMPIRLTWDAWRGEYFSSVSPDGKRVAFCLGGGAGGWRRPDWHGSSNADIWLADLTTPLSDLTRLTHTDVNEYWPMWSGDGKQIYFVWGKSGTPNIWRMKPDGSDARQVTRHRGDKVRLPSLAPQAGKIVYEYDSQIWICDLESEKTHPISIQAGGDVGENLVYERRYTSGISEYEPSPDGKKIAFIVRGELFVVPAVKGGLARRLTSNSWRESNPAWSPDSTRIAFCSDRNGNKDLFTIGLTGQDEKQITSSPEDETNPVYSLDGKQIAYHRDIHLIEAVPAEGGDPKTLVKGDFAIASAWYDPAFSFSPDGKWLVYNQPGSMLEDNVWVANLDDGTTHQIASLAKGTSVPQWSKDGKLIYFSNWQYENSDIYAVDLVPKAEVDFAEDELDKLDKKLEPPKTEAKPEEGKAEGAKPAEKVPEVKIVFEGIDKRLRRITSAEDNEWEPLLTPDGKTFVFFSDQLDGTNIWTLPADPKEGGRLTQITTGRSGKDDLRMSSDGKKVYFLSGGVPQTLDLGSKAVSATSFDATVIVNMPAENQQVFNEAWWVLDRTFYDPNLHGKDWPAIRERYQALLPFAPLKSDFYDLMTEMILELDASHMGVGYPTDPPEGAADTAILGVEWDWRTLEKDGLFRIASIMPESPAAQPGSKLNLEEYVLAIDGTDLAPETNLDVILDRKVGRKVVLLVNNIPTKEGARTVAIKPISRGEWGNLFYQDFVDTQRAMVDKLSGGRLGYIHIRGMGDADLAKFKVDLVTRGDGKEGLVVDVRFNGGGYIAADLLGILEKKPYVYFQPRGLEQHISDQMARDWSWEKPLALLINEGSGSNSEMFAEGFRRLGLGPIVGVPTYGGVISTGGWGFLDGGSIRTPSWGVYTVAGENLERKARDPDYLVEYDPIAAAAGRDPQTEKAVQALLEAIDKQASH